MRRTTPSVVVLLVLAGCGGGSSAPAPTVTVTASATTPAPVAGGTMRPGQTLHLPTADLTVTKVGRVELKEPVSQKSLPRLGAWAKACNTSKVGLNFAWTNWSASGTGSTVYPSDSSASYGNAGVQFYPDGRITMKPGGCSEGWIVFEAPATAKITTIDYANGRGDTASWTVPA